DGITEHGGGFYMYKTTSSTESNIDNMMAKQNADLLKFMQSNSIEMSGSPFTIYNAMNDDGSVIMSNAIPVQNMIIVAEDSNILCGYMDRTKVLKTTLKGNYTNLDEAWNTAKQYVKDNNLETSEMPVFETYTKDSSTSENPANWVTELYIPLKAEPVETEQM
ncbi:MAG: GyrI-like domain-containing protein, partial [Aquaticitalea sp.]